MCLSPEVDLAAAVVTGVIAVDTYHRNSNPDARALVAIPAIFTIHNLSSALMWWWLRGTISDAVGLPAEKLYMVIAFALWPIYVPIAIRAMETDTRRRRALAVLWVLGLAVAIPSAYWVATGVMHGVAHDHYVSFVSTSSLPYISLFYGLSTIGATLVSSHRELVAWGLVNAVVVVLLDKWAEAGLPSVWCFWAAITTGYINWFIRGHSRRFHGQQNPEA